MDLQWKPDSESCRTEASGTVYRGRDRRNKERLTNNAPYALKVTLEKMNLAAPAKLTLNLKEEWNADKVLYCLEENGKIYQLDTAKISTRESGKKKVKRTTLTF